MCKGGRGSLVVCVREAVVLLGLYSWLLAFISLLLSRRRASAERMALLRRLASVKRRGSNVPCAMESAKSTKSGSA